MSAGSIYSKFTHTKSVNVVASNIISEKTNNIRQQMFKEWGHEFRNYDEFEKVFIKATEDFKCMVVNSPEVKNTKN